MPTPLSVVILSIPAAGTAVGPGLFLDALLSAQLHCVSSVGKLRHSYLGPPPSLQASLPFSSTG